MPNNNHDEPVISDECRRGYGDDTSPWMIHVREAPRSHWGKLTSQSRDASEEYRKFKEKKNHG